MDVIKYINMALSFLLELSALAIFGFWGYTTGGNSPLRYFLGIGAVVLAGLVWSIWGAPKSKNHLTGVAYLAFSLAFFLLAAVLLFGLGLPGLAMAFAVVCVINRALTYVWRADQEMAIK
jgi:hypothetical protein